MQIKDVTKRRNNEVVIHYIDDNGDYCSLSAYPGDIIAWHNAAQQSVQADFACVCGKCEPLEGNEEFCKFTRRPIPQSR